VSNRIRGSCLCGLVRFEIDKAAGPFEICHCNRCRKVSGSHGLAAVGVNTSDYHFLAGVEHVQTYTAPILRDPPAYQSYFCSKCGSPVPSPSPEGSWMEIPAGIFDDDIGMAPDKHILVEYMPPWDSITDSLPCFERAQLESLRAGRESEE
jgi:hypothetical protein